MILRITPSAKSFMQTQKIEDVTFILKVFRTRCCVGIVKEIEAIYEAPGDACNYKYFHVDGFHFYISREIKILGSLTVTLEGFWKMKRLGISGAGIPI